MKLRLRDNTLRLRLTQTEVATLRNSGLLSTKTAFSPSSALEYTLESTPASVAPNASFEDCRINVRLPEAAVVAWADSDEVGIEGEQPLERGETLQILVEKDFACLAPRAGDEDADTFAHPEAGSRTC